MSKFSVGCSLIIAAVKMCVHACVYRCQRYCSGTKMLHILFQRHFVYVMKMKVIIQLLTLHVRVKKAIFSRIEQSCSLFIYTGEWIICLDIFISSNNLPVHKYGEKDKLSVRTNYLSA